LIKLAMDFLFKGGGIFYASLWFQMCEMWFYSRVLC
jgi:hypothetical protein